MCRTMQYGTAQSYFTEVETKLNPDSPTWNYDTIAKGYTAPPAPPAGEMSVPTWKDELYFEYHRGVFTTQAEHKRNMRESESGMLDAEKHGVAGVAGWADAYPADELTEEWKKVCSTSFMIWRRGRGLAMIYKDAQKDYDQVQLGDE